MKQTELVNHNQGNSSAKRPIYNELSNRHKQIQEILKIIINSNCETILVIGNECDSLPDYLFSFTRNSKQTIKILRHQGHLNKLPFDGACFDLVCCFNISDQLEKKEIENILRETQRVAKNNVLIAVQYNEESGESLTTGKKGSVNLGSKLNTLSPSLEALLNTPLYGAYERRAFFLSGSITTHPNIEMRQIATQTTDLPEEKEYGVCLSCSDIQLDTASKTKDSQLEKSNDAICFHSLNRQISQTTSWSNRSDIVLLLTKNSNSITLPTSNCTLEQGSMLEICFSNFQQKVSEFVPGSMWGQFIPAKGTKIDKQGISLISSDCTQLVPIMIRIPIAVQREDSLIIKASANKKARFSLFGAEQPNSKILTLLENYEVSSEKKIITVKISQPWLADSFGTALHLYLHGDIHIEKISYQLNNLNLMPHPFVNVQPGLNSVLVGTIRHIPVFWTLHTQSQGKLPIFVNIPENRPAAPLPKETNRYKRKALSILATLRVLFNKKKNEVYGFININGRKLIRKIFFINGKLNVEKFLNYPERWQAIANEDIQETDGKNILVVSHLFPHPDQPGLGSFVLEQIKSLKNEALNVRVISGRPFWISKTKNPFHLLGNLVNYIILYKACSTRWWLVEGVPVRFIPYPILGPFWTHGWSYVASVRINHKKIKSQFKCDLIHAHTSYLDGSSGRKLAQKYKCPYIITEHTGPFSALMNHPTIKSMTLKTLKNATQVITVSQAQQKNVLFYLGSQYEKKFRVIPNSVDLNVFHSEDKWYPDPLKPKILFVGYFVPIKNIPLLLRSFQYVLTQIPLAQLTLVGGSETPESAEKLKADIKSLGLDKHLTIRSYLPQTEVAYLMRNACDLLVLSSKAESFGCVVAEAMACGRPAVITPCGGAEDIVIDSSHGEVSKDHNPIALGDAILKVIQRLPLMDSEKISNSARERFSSEIVSKTYIKLYHDVVKNNSSGFKDNNND